MSSSRAELFAFARNTVLRAGAGTGKTEALTTVYLHLVGGLASPEVWPRQGLLPERIVALTFTDKAAIEMRERIAEAVALLSFEPLPAALEAEDTFARERAVRQWGQTRGLSEAVIQRVRALADSAAANGRALPGPEAWQRVGFALGAARIGTFHSFAAGVLRAAALDLGLDPAFDVIDQEEADRLLRSAVVAALSQAARHDVAAVADLMATTGGIDAEGDHGLVARVADLVRNLDEAGIADDALGTGPVVIASGVEPYIAADMLARFAKACELLPSLVEDGSVKRVATLAERVGQLTAERDPVARARAVAELLGAFPLPGRNRTQKICELADAARDTVEALRDGALALLSERLATHARAVVLDSRARFRAVKRERAVLDFADLIRGLRDALRDHPGLRRAWKRRFDAVLVDEFQDTNRVQRDLLCLLREKRDQESPAGVVPSAKDMEPAGLLLVGDAKQSIYAFRGADVSVFFETEDALAEAGGARLELIESHRSLDTVIEAINPATEALLGAGLIAHRESMYDRRRDALTAEQQGDGRARVEVMLVQPGSADEVRASEAEAIAQRIGVLTAPSSALALGEGWRPARFDEIAILVPSWNHLDPVKKALNDAGIPYALLGGPGFWERREVDDLVVLLRFVADPSDRMALASVLRGPLVGVSDAGLARLFARPGTLDDVLDPPAPLRLLLAPEDRARLDEARPTMRRLVRFGATLGPEAVLRLALTERGYAAVLAALPFGAQRVANVDKLVGLAAAAERRGGEESDLVGFLRYIDRMRAAAQHETEADVADVSTGAVQILSIHAAKGLEWPVVFVAQTSRRRRTHAERLLIDTQRRLVALPAGFAAPDHFRELRRDVHAAEDDDQRRLLYVALTRARDLVIVSGPEADGEGEWLTLSQALKREAPMRVRLLAPGKAGEPLPVRATPGGGERESIPPTDALAHAIDPPAIPRRRLAIAPGALREFERCPRRYYSLHELGLAEPGRGGNRGPGASADAVLAALREIVARVDPATLAASPVAAVDAATGALATALEAEPLALAAPLAIGLGRSALGRALAQPGALVARALPVAVTVGEGDESLALHGRVDLVVRGDALGRDAGELVVVHLAVARGGGGGVHERDAAEHALALGAWRLGIARRFDATLGGDAPEVACAVAYVSPEGCAVEVLAKDATGAEALTRRVAEIGHELARARAQGEWDGRPRGACERLRCGFVSRCHGA